ncbi:MAG TPA: flagellar biogenesis protein [Ruminiclostridium sp.]|jgi:flagellar protein FliO/FliZ|nr:FliO/MopB family protein [Clostridiaceae bacterium]HAA25028.1 flagellar biogenesis protein [Ruminiclostridium sp.]
MLLELLGVVLVFGSILFLAYVASKYVGKKAAGSMKSKHMQVVEQISISLDKRLVLVRVGTDYFLFLSGKREFKLVARLTPDKMVELEQQEGTSDEPVFDFKRILNKYISKSDEKTHMKKTRVSTESNSSGDSTIKRNINKLLQLREKRYDKEV